MLAPSSFGAFPPALCLLSSVLGLLLALQVKSWVQIATILLSEAHAHGRPDSGKRFYLRAAHRAKTTDISRQGTVNPTEAQQRDIRAALC
jgi:hypothetical protein